MTGAAGMLLTVPAGRPIEIRHGYANRDGVVTWLDWHRVCFSAGPGQVVIPSAADASEWRCCRNGGPGRDAAEVDVEPSRPPPKP